MGEVGEVRSYAAISLVRTGWCGDDDHERGRRECIPSSCSPMANATRKSTTNHYHSINKRVQR